jgi:hypothetical protein
MRVDGYGLRIGRRATLVLATGARPYGMFVSLTPPGPRPATGWKPCRFPPFAGPRTPAPCYFHHLKRPRTSRPGSASTCSTAWLDQKDLDDSGGTSATEAGAEPDSGPAMRTSTVMRTCGPSRRGHRNAPSFLQAPRRSVPAGPRTVRGPGAPVSEGAVHRRSQSSTRIPDTRPSADQIRDALASTLPNKLSMVMVASHEVRALTDVAARIRVDFLAPAAVARTTSDLSD